MQERKHYRQHATHDGKVRQQPGRAGGREDISVHRGEEKGGHVALQHDASVSSSRFFAFISTQTKEQEYCNVKFQQYRCLSLQIYF